MQDTQLSVQSEMKLMFEQGVSNEELLEYAEVKVFQEQMQVQFLILYRHIYLMKIQKPVQTKLILKYK